MKILICGAYGQLGSDCAVVFSEAHQVLASDMDKLDITDEKAVLTAVRHHRPDWIINCAAYTNVDACETDPAGAERLNAHGPRYLAAAARQTEGRLLHVSTDYVFDGGRELPAAYTEDDTVNPVSVYGKTKAAGEQAVLTISRDHCVVRTAWLYGITGKNFLKTMLRLALKNPGRSAAVVADQFGSPTWSRTLARQLKMVIEGGGCGLYHATAEGYCSWYDLTCFFLKKMDVPHAITPCTTEAYPTPARRPRNSILENSRLKTEKLHGMRHWQEDVEDFVNTFRGQLLQECAPD